MESVLQQTKPKTDWLGLIILFIIVASAVVICSYIIIEKIHNCTSDPLKYLTMKTMTDDNMSYSYIKVYLFLDKNDVVPIKILDFELKDGTNR